jgi:hypothetical protein
MKAKFLKIAGVKNEEQFYKKYPTEAAFFKAHPEAKQLKQAKMGSYIGGEQDAIPQYQSYQDYANLVPLSIMGKTQEQIKGEAEKKEMLDLQRAQTAAAQQGGGGGLMNMLKGIGGGGLGKGSQFGDIAGGGSDMITPGAGDSIGGMVDVGSFAKKGKKVKKAQVGDTVSGALSGQQKEKPDILGGITQGLPIVGDIVSGIQMLKETKKQRKELETAAKVSDLALQASRTQPERKQRRYVRPEDAVVSPNERFIPGGTGTEILAEYGASIGGNPTEIQNMYNPGDLYSDLGYEPLSDSDIIKQYRSGGLVPKAATGFESFMASGGGAAASNLLSSAAQQQGLGGGSKIGGAIGKGVGMAIGGPAGGTIGEMGGTLYGAGLQAVLDAKGAKEQKRNEDKLAGNIKTMGTESSIRGALGNYSSIVRNGGDIPYAENGWMSHDWQPQKIVKFGEYDVKDLLAPDETMDTLRTGGSIRQNNMSELDQFNFGGSLKTHWGGRAEVDSYNPYLPGTGETVMFKGNQHSESDGTGKTGIGVSYGPKEHDSYTDYAEYGSEQAADVEVENGEPAIQLPESGSESPMQRFAFGGQQNTNNLSMTVYGALNIDRNAAMEIGDPEAEGLTYKKYVAGLNDEENKANKKLAKANEELEDLKVNTPFDRLKLNSLQSIIQGSDQELQRLAALKTNAAGVQNAYNETADELGLDADALAKGKVKAAKSSDMAKYGKEIEKAQIGKSLTPIIGKLSDFLRQRGLNLPEKDTDTNPLRNVKSLPPPKIKELKEIVITPSKEYMEARRKKAAATTSGNAKKKTTSGKRSKVSSKKSTTSENTYVPPKTPLVLQSAQNAAVDPKDPLGLERIFPEQESSYVMPPYSRESFEEGLEDVAKGFKDYRKRKSVDGGLKADRPTAAVKSEPSSAKKDKKEKTDWQDLAKAAITQLGPLLRRPLQEDLRGDQLYGEMMAKAQNQLEPVQAQTFQPLLDTPFDVSFKDRLNENQATFNALLRTPGVANNPAAQSALAANKYQADSQVLADQFRTNQAMRADVFSKNREKLNDAQLKNLAILDQQYTRQAEALSKTKATDLAIANSISDKIAKNRLENRTFAAYSNMFPQYGFNRDMMAFSQLPTFFNKGQVPGLSPEDAKEFQEWYNQKNKAKTASTTTGKYGKELKKHFKNGNIVKSFKG